MLYCVLCDSSHLILNEKEVVKKEFLGVFVPFVVS